MTSADSTVIFRAIPRRCKLSPKEKRNLEKFACTLSESIAKGRAWMCLVTNDRALQKLNQQFLEHDYPTDVLSFPWPPESALLGEVAISAERANEQAAQFGHPTVKEICILMLHGILHLTGMDHERDKGEMARAERRWRGKFDLPPTLIVRSKAKQ